MKQNFQLCWIREPDPGVIQADLGLEIAPDQLELAILGLLPEQLPVMSRVAVTRDRLHKAIENWAQFEATPRWFQKTLAGFFGNIRDFNDLRMVRNGVGVIQQLSNRIRSLAPDGRTEIHLPHVGRRDWPARIDILRRTEFVRDRARILPRGFEPDCFDQTVRRIAAASYSESSHTISHSARYEGPMLSLWSNRLAERYGVQLPANTTWSQIWLSVHGSELDAWSAAPRERGKIHSRCLSRLSLGIQSALRIWLPALHLSTVESWARVDDAQDLLAYSATPVFTNLPHYLTYDILEPLHMDHIRLKTTRRIVAAWAQVSAFWKAAGRPDIARSFASFEPPARAGEQVARALYRRRVRSIIVGETGIIDAFAIFMQRIKEMEHSRHMGPVLDDLDRSLKHHVGRLVPQAHFEFLRQLLLVEVTNALHIGLRRSPALEAQFISEDGEVYCNNRTLCDSLSPI